ncbi:MAG: adenylyl-sulfate kinase [Thermoleophilaceae bacterium]|nr:adenylyl-sulfate kinase [Thermoleophilaceae bacterium]
MDRSVEPEPGAGPGGHATAPTRASTLRIATAGSVDDGKSTLIGRLLLDSKQVFADQLRHVEEASRRRGDGYVDLALLTDGLRAEREQGITIDVAYRYFATPRRRFIVADTPGHARYTRNMVTGASTADVSLILLDARKGVVEQTKRHAFVSALVGVRHLVICVNKLDLVDWSERVFDEIVSDFGDFAAKLELGEVTFIPISALHGDNVVERSGNTPWYDGPPLLYHLEHLHVASDRNLVDCRFPVQWVIRPLDDEHSGYRGYAGQVASGVFRAGDEVVVLPSGERTRIAGIDGPEGELEEAFPPMSVALRLADDVDVSRGDVICRPDNRPTRARDIEAMVCWMSERPLRPGQRLHLKHTTRWTQVTVEDVRYRVDVETLHRDRGADRLELNDIGRVHLRTSSLLLVDDYRRNRQMGSFILVDEATNDTVAAGMISAIVTGDGAREAGRSPNVVWQPSAIERPERWRALGACGATVWLTGLPASGKSTIGAALERALVERGAHAYMLDGDNLRHGLNGNLGFSAEDRSENIRRTAEVARLFADAGSIAIVTLVSPYRSDRERARELHARDGLEFVEVHVDTPLEECERRDPKGLYARARRGELTGMTGVDDPYEPPEQPDLTIAGGEPGEAVARILEELERRGIVAP